MQELEAGLEMQRFCAIQELGLVSPAAPAAQTSAGSTASAPALVPTIILSANSPAVGDQSATYTRLQQHLKDQVCFSAHAQSGVAQDGVTE
jgi:hypothetical protein